MTSAIDWRLSRDPWTILAQYNAEVARGIVHTDEWRAEMAKLQAAFDETQRAQLVDEGMAEAEKDERRRAWWRR